MQLVINARDPVVLDALAVHFFVCQTWTATEAEDPGSRRLFVVTAVSPKGQQ